MATEVRIHKLATYPTYRIKIHTHSDDVKFRGQQEEWHPKEQQNENQWAIKMWNSTKGARTPPSHSSRIEPRRLGHWALQASLLWQKIGAVFEWLNMCYFISSEIWSGEILNVQSFTFWHQLVLYSDARPEQLWWVWLRIRWRWGQFPGQSGVPYQHSGNIDKVTSAKPFQIVMRTG